jgi:tetratricopeptide (TPR) repeat protein
MLATVREFCRTRAEPDPEAWPAVLAYLCRLVEQRGEGTEALFDAEWTNFRAALQRTEGEDPAAMLRLAGGLTWFWYVRGHYREGLRWLEAALAGAGETAAVADRRAALQGAGELAFLLCYYAEAEALLTQAEMLGDERGVAAAEQMLGSIARERGDYAAARQWHGRSLAAWRAIGERAEAARAENYLLFVDWLESGGAAPAESAAATGEAFAELGHVEGAVWSQLHQGAVALYAGERGVAKARLGRAFADAVAAKFQEGIAWALNLLGLVSTAAGEWVQARAQLRASLKVHRRLGDLWRCASVLEAYAAVCADTGDAVKAGQLLAAASALRERIGAPVPACERARHALTAAKAVPAEASDLDAAVALVQED